MSREVFLKGVARFHPRAETARGRHAPFKMQRSDKCTPDGEPTAVHDEYMQRSDKCTPDGEPAGGVHEERIRDEQRRLIQRKDTGMFSALLCDKKGKCDANRRAY